MDHKSVLLKEAIELLDIKKDGTYVDCTLGRAGHSSEILKLIPDGKLICFDQDEQAIKESEPILKKIGKNFIIIKSNFSNLEAELALLNINKVDGILYDLGLSSPQLDEAKRGFSYKHDAKLDMRMDPSVNFSAYNIVNNYDFKDLFFIFSRYGEEKYSGSIAKKIIKVRETKKIETTLELVDIIRSSVPQKYLRKKGHPAKKIFQAIRIEVNNELDVFENSLKQALNLLDKNGRIVVISFHSLEDKITKRTFKEMTTSPYHYINKKLPIDIKWKSSYEIINKKIILPSQDELEHNNRSHSAKMRAIKKI